MDALYIILIALGACVVLPVVAYLVMKFGTAGFLRAKERNIKPPKKNEIEE